MTHKIATIVLAVTVAVLSWQVYDMQDQLLWHSDALLDQSMYVAELEDKLNVLADAFEYRGWELEELLAD